MKEFFEDLKTAIKEIYEDISLVILTWFYPDEWNIAKKIASSSKKN